MTDSAVSWMWSRCKHRPDEIRIPAYRWDPYFQTLAPLARFAKASDIEGGDVHVMFMATKVYRDPPADEQLCKMLIPELI